MTLTQSVCWSIKMATLVQTLANRSRVVCQLVSLSSSRNRCLAGRCFGTGSAARGLDEFFPPNTLEKGELAQESVKTGRKWNTRELRAKSNEDLHKLWYVLLKERNMLNTLMHEAKRQGVAMPSPERYHKVKKSMASIKTVIGERERVLKELERQQWTFDEEETKQSTATNQGKVDREEITKTLEHTSKSEQTAGSNAGDKLLT